jgi:hypothetical protein
LEEILIDRLKDSKNNEYFNKHKKKDDLADAFLQAIYYIDFNKL